MLNISKRLLICCALACCTISARADQPAESSPTVPCCGREAAVSRPLVGREPSLQAGSVNNDLSNCVCLKYIYAHWGEMCDFYATDCYGSPFPWRDFCNTPHPGECETDSDLLRADMLHDFGSGRRACRVEPDCRLLRSRSGSLEAHHGARPIFGHGQCEQRPVELRLPEVHLRNLG